MDLRRPVSLYYERYRLRDDLYCWCEGWALPMRIAFYEPLARLALAVAFFASSVAINSASLLAAEPLKPIEADEQERAAIESLIRQLGDDSYEKREAAGEALLAMGLKALPFVARAVRSDDFEIRYRSEQIRQKLGAGDLTRRLEAFEKDPTDETDYGIPGWKEFRDRYGKLRGAKAMFVKMFREDRELMELEDDDTQRIKHTISMRLWQLQQNLSNNDQSKNFPLGKVAAILHKGKGSAETDFSGNINQIRFNLCYQQAFQQGMVDENARHVLRAILTRQIVDAEGWEFQQGLNLALQYDIKEALGPAIKLVESRGGGQVHLLSQALMAVVRFGGEEHIEAIEPLLAEKQVVMQFQHNKARKESQIGDMAMAAILKLASKDPKQFGIELQGNGPGQTPNLQMVGFENEASRQAARQKFDPFFTEWKAAHPSKGAGEKKPAEKLEVEKSSAEKLPAEKSPPETSK